MYVLYTCGELLFDCFKTVCFSIYLYYVCIRHVSNAIQTYKRIGTKAFNRPETFYQYKSVMYIH